MKKFMTIVLVFVMVAMLLPCTVAFAGHWYTMHDLNYMMEQGDYHALVMKPVLLEADRAEFVDFNNPREKLYITYHKGYFEGYGDMKLAARDWDREPLESYVEAMCTEPNIQDAGLGKSYQGNRDDLISYTRQYTYTDENGYNGYRQIMVLKNWEDMYLFEYYNDAESFDSDRTMGTIEYYYYFGERREGDNSAPEYIEAPPPIKLVIDGNPVVSDADPLMINDRTLVPVRAVASGLGYAVEWDESTYTVTLQKDRTTLKIGIDYDIIRKQWVEFDPQTGRDDIKSEQYKADVPAQIIEGRTYLPVRAVSEALGCKVEWEDATRTVFVTTVETPEPEVTVVFIGEAGDVYHKRSNCSTLPPNTAVGTPLDFVLNQGIARCSVCWY